MEKEDCEYEIIIEKSTLTVHELNVELYNQAIVLTLNKYYNNENLNCFELSYVMHYNMIIENNKFHEIHKLASKINDDNYDECLINKILYYSKNKKYFKMKRDIYELLKISKNNVIIGIGYLELSKYYYEIQNFEKEKFYLEKNLEFKNFDGLLRLAMIYLREKNIYNFLDLSIYLINNNYKKIFPKMVEFIVNPTHCKFNQDEEEIDDEFNILENEYYKNFVEDKYFMYDILLTNYKYNKSVTNLLAIVCYTQQNFVDVEYLTILNNFNTDYPEIVNTELLDYYYTKKQYDKMLEQSKLCVMNTKVSRILFNYFDTSNKHDEQLFINACNYIVKNGKQLLQIRKIIRNSCYNNIEIMSNLVKCHKNFKLLNTKKCTIDKKQIQCPVLLENVEYCFTTNCNHEYSAVIIFFDKCPICRTKL